MECRLKKSLSILLVFYIFITVFVFLPTKFFGEEVYTSGLSIIKVSSNKVQIKWRCNWEKSIFMIYRRKNRSIYKPESLDDAKLLNIVEERGDPAQGIFQFPEYMDTILESGKYYYLVLPKKSKYIDEDFKANINYSIEPLVFKFATNLTPVPTPPVSNIITNAYSLELVKISSNKVKIKWKYKITNIEFGLYRQTNGAISTAELFTNAQLVSITNVKGQATDDLFKFFEYTDTVTENGDYYYVILPKKTNYIDDEFLADENYNTKPIVFDFIKKPEPKPKLNTFNLELIKISSNSVRIKWKYNIAKAKYSLYRQKNKPIDAAELFSEAQLVATTELFKKAHLVTTVGVEGQSSNDIFEFLEYTDTVTENGDYYYAILLKKNYYEKDEFSANENYNTKPVVFNFIKKTKPIPKTIVYTGTVSAKNLLVKKQRNTFFVFWTIDKNAPEDDYLFRIYRTTKAITASTQLQDLIPHKEILNDFYFEDTDVDYGVPYYYTVVLSNNIKVFPGVNSTLQPVVYGNKIDVSVEREVISDRVRYLKTIKNQKIPRKFVYRKISKKKHSKNLRKIEKDVKIYKPKKQPKTNDVVITKPKEVFLTNINIINIKVGTTNIIKPKKTLPKIEKIVLEDNRGEWWLNIPESDSSVSTSMKTVKVITNYIKVDSPKKQVEKKVDKKIDKKVDPPKKQVEKPKKVLVEDTTDIPSEWQAVSESFVYNGTAVGNGKDEKFIISRGSATLKRDRFISDDTQQEQFIITDKNKPVVYKSTAAKLKPKPTVNYSRLAISYYNKGWYAQAAEKFKMSNYRDKNYYIGKCYYKLADYNKAYAYFDKYTSVNPSKAKLWKKLTLNRIGEK